MKRRQLVVSASARAFLIACSAAALLLALPAAASAAELPEFNMLSHPTPEGTTITQMNMTTGVYSGTSIVSGVNFTVEGTEVGNKAVAVLTDDSDPSYKSTNTDYEEILPNGFVGGPGEFEDTDGHHGTYHGELNAPDATTASSTEIFCSYDTSISSRVYECLASVFGSGGTPTGNITFSASSGSFQTTNQCVLSQGNCKIYYVPPASGLANRITISAVYSADATFRVSQSSLPLCGSGGVAITSVTPEPANPEGIVPGQKVKLTGKGFCPGMTAYFGNEQATSTYLSSPADTAETTATVTVPWLATTGTLSVLSEGQTAKFAEPLTINSFRNTSGLSFENLTSYPTTVAQFEAAFGPETVTFVTPSNPTGTLSPRGLAIFRHFSKEFSAGLCFGWSFAALHLESGALPLSAYDPDASFGWDLSQTPSLEELIAIEFWKQFSNQFQAWERGAYKSQNTFSDLKDELDLLNTDNGEAFDGEPISLDFFEPKGNKVIWTGAHEVVGYATTPYDVPGEPEGIEVHVADPNRPFDKEENDANGALHAQRLNESTIRITPAPNGRYYARWHGKNAVVTIGLKTIINAPLTPWAPPEVFTSRISPGNHLQDLIKGAGKSLTIGGTEGEVIPEQVLNENTPPTDSFSAPLGAYEETISGTSEIDDLMETSNLTAEVEASAGTDNISFNPATETLGVAPSSGTPAASAAPAEKQGRREAGARITSGSRDAASKAAKLPPAATLTLISAQPNRSERSVVVSGPSGNAVSLAHGDVVVTNTTGHSEAIHLTLGNNAGTPREFLSPAITLSASGKLTAKPRWTALSHPLTVKITTRGHKSRSEKLANKSRPVAATITKVAASHGKTPSNATIGLHIPSLPVGSGVTVQVHVMSGRHTVRTITRNLTLPSKAGSATLTVELGAAPKHARIGVVVITAASGAATTVARRQRTVAWG